MAERARQEILEELKAKNIPVYSFSKIETINNCLYEAYLTYIKGMRDQQEPNVYASLGTKIHDTLEQITNGEATEADLLPALQSELQDMDLLGIEFPKGKDGSDSIRNSWIADMTDFCQTYKAPKGKFETESFFLYKTPDRNYLQGYIDLTRIRPDGSIDIYDYKTSSMYIGAAKLAHSRQLTLYAMAKEQEGYHVNSISWIFLKYVDVIFIGKKTSKSKTETQVKRTIERKNLVRDLVPEIKLKLLARGIEEFIADTLIDEALQINKIPECLKDEFIVRPCVLQYPYNEKTRAEADEYFDDTISRWESMTQNEDEFIPKGFTRVSRGGKIVDDSFYDSSLCGYRKICPHLKKYQEERFADNDEDIF